MNSTNKEITGFFTDCPRARHTTFFEGGFLNILLSCFKYGVTDSTVVISVIISERELIVHVRYMSSSVRLSCLSSVTFVHPTQAIEIFGNVSTPFGNFAICDPTVKILRRSSQGNPSVGGLNQRGRKNIASLDLSKAISRKRCKIGGNYY